MTAGPAATWWRRRSLRARLMLISVGGLTAGLLAGAVLLVSVLGAVLQRSADNDSARTASDVAALVRAGVLPHPLPVAGPDQVQVVDAKLRVRAASIGADRLVPMLTPAEMERAWAGERLVIDGARLGLSGPVRVFAASTDTPADPQTVLVARSLTDVRRGIGLVRTSLIVALPLLVAGLAALVWRICGAVLRPVEALRRTAEEITDLPAPRPPSPDQLGSDHRSSDQRGSAPKAARLPVPAGDDEVHRLAVTLNRMLDRLAAARARQREFVSDAAHELRSPLANLTTQLEVALRLGAGADWPAVAADLLADTTRMARLVDDLLVLARADEGAPRRDVAVELGALLGDVAQAYPTVAYAAPQDPLWIRGEPDALRRIVGNLLDNAVRYAPTAVTLAVAAGADGVEVTVTDDGPGIAEPDRDRVFERFVRLDSGRARPRDGGAGLGLAIVRQLVHRHGGTVTLEDATIEDATPKDAVGRPGAVAPGLRVRVRLPSA